MIAEVRASADAGADRVVVRIRGVDHFFGKGGARKQVLDGIALELHPGEISVLTGPSGSGKSTLLTLIGGLRSVQAGSLEVRGRELRGLAARDLVAVRRAIGFIFQAHNLFESLTAHQNVRLALDLHDVSGAESRARAAEALTVVGLGDRLHAKPQALSGGQRQRVAIARALVNRPALILADEPTAALDREASRDVVDLLRRLTREQRSAVVLVTHDNRILDVADRIVNLVDGRIVSDVAVHESVTICEFLARCPVFAALSPGTLAEVAEKMSPETYPAGARLVRQGDPGEKFYVIRRGRTEVVLEEGAQRRVVASLDEGDFFGEMALLTGEPRSATVVALDPVEVYTLGKSDFQAALAASAGFKEQLLNVFFQRR